MPHFSRCRFRTNDAAPRLASILNHEIDNATAPPPAEYARFGAWPESACGHAAFSSREATSDSWISRSRLSASSWRRGCQQNG